MVPVSSSCVQLCAELLRAKRSIQTGKEAFTSTSKKQKLSIATGQVEKALGSHAVSGEKSGEPQLRFHSAGKQCFDEVKVELLKHGKLPGAPVMCIHSSTMTMRDGLLRP